MRRRTGKKLTKVTRYLLLLCIPIDFFINSHFLPFVMMLTTTTTMMMMMMMMIFRRRFVPLDAWHRQSRDLQHPHRSPRTGQSPTQPTKSPTF